MSNGSSADAASATIRCWSRSDWPVSDVFAPYERSKRLYAGAGALFSFVTVAAASVMMGQRRSLLASRRALTVTLDTMSQGIAMIDAEGNVPVLNQRAIHLLGLPRKMISSNPRFREIVEWQFANGEFGEETTWDAALACALRSPRQAILLTGYAGHGAQLAIGGSLGGAFALVRKPVTAAQLADRIEALLAVNVAG
jgi:PAS domain-containing protein